MAFYVDKDLGQGTVTCKDYDLYCHFGKYVTHHVLYLHTVQPSQLPIDIDCPTDDVNAAFTM